MLIDILIILFAISALYRGREIGFLRQFFSTAGFLGGLFVGAWLQPHTINLVHSQASRSLVSIVTTLGCAFILLAMGEYVGTRLKMHVQLRRINRIDISFGAILNVVALLVSTWLIAAILGALPLPGLQTTLKSSRIVSALDTHLPPAPNVIAGIGNLIDPNGFPQVFIGNEPAPHPHINLPPASELRPVVEKDQASVVKVEGQGCGGIVDGSGFVAATNLVITNAHVVAGIRSPYVQDGSGTHYATTVYFDPNLDIAILRVSRLTGSPLSIASNVVNDGTPAAVLGYPGGGGFTADTAAVLDSFNARGRNIYGSGNTNRNIYEVQATVIPGNSGGPLIDKDGAVIGVIFAESTTYEGVGYALTTPAVLNALHQAETHHQAVTTGSCAE